MDISFPFSITFGTLVRAARQRRPGRRRRGRLGGEWWQHIPAHGGQPPKLDFVSCRHVGDELTAKIRRVEPEKQNRKSWTFRGHVRNDMVFGAFFSDHPNDRSYGTILLRMGDDPARWDGFYNRLHCVDMGLLRQEEIVKVEHCWSRARILERPLPGALT